MLAFLWIDGEIAPGYSGVLQAVKDFLPGAVVKTGGLEIQPIARVKIYAQRIQGGQITGEAGIKKRCPDQTCHDKEQADRQGRDFPSG